MNRPFLQTVEWLGFQKHLGRSVWRLDDGFLKANIIQHNVRFGQNYLYIPYGPELNLELAREGIRNEVEHFSRYLHHLARQEKSMFVKIEPLHDMVVELLMRNKLPLHASSKHIQPRRTMMIDLAQSDDQLLTALHHKHRYNINRAQRHGVTVDESTDTDAFWKLLQQTSEHDDFRTHGMLYYKKLLHYFSDDSGNLRTRLYLAHHGGRPVAGALLMEYNNTVTYLHGAMDRTQRALMAPHVLHWDLLRRYRDRGFGSYDFWGIDAAKWPGVTRFKLGFGGRVVEYPGAFDFVCRPFMTVLYKLGSS